MVNVIGLGYIGLPTAIMLASRGIRVVGTDCSIELVEKLRKYGVVMEFSENIEDLRFEGKTFVLSGGLDSMTRSRAEEIIESFGGKTSSSVSSKTSYLLLGDKPGSKLEKARKLGVEIIDEQQFLKITE